MTVLNKILKASAGSGKTFALAREYIRLLLAGGDFPHRHILAVTFTNKATAEMKKRILDELYALAVNPSSSKYCESLCGELGVDAETLGKRASRVLGEILNDYGSFAVSTIDRFFQQVLRAFARENGQVSEYQVELDKDSLVSEAADRVMDSLSEKDSPLLKWLSGHAAERMNSGENFHMQALVREFASLFFKEEFRDIAGNNGINIAEAFSEANLLKLQKCCRKCIRDFDDAFRLAASDLYGILSGFPEKTINTNLLKYSAKLRDYDGGELTPNGSGYWLNGLEDGSETFRSAAKGKYCPADFDRIKTAMNAVEDLIRNSYPSRRTAVILLGQAPLLRTAEELDRAFEEVLKDRNVLSLDDTNNILRDIIGGTDTPFIYEKVGVRYNHFLLDEFQDTSAVQWENFLPLLKNPTDADPFNLIVGDVKQSIYRWRNARWEILQNEVSSSLSGVSEEPLDTNWRSAGAIVDFNNGFFKYLAASFDTLYSSRTSLPSVNKISSMYSDVAQKVGRTGLEGSVEVSFNAEGENRLDMPGMVLNAVKDALERGFALRDIAVLVRTNSMGSQVAARLVREKIKVVSNDSLYVNSSPLVRKTVARMALLDSPGDKLYAYEAGEDFKPESVYAGASLPDIAENIIRQFNPDEVNADTLYILAFMDLVRDFVKRDGNSLHGFINWWEDKGVKQNISSPEGGDALTVITIHKAKGLDFPFVILPLPGKDGYNNTKGTLWALPDIPDGSELSIPLKAPFNVSISEMKNSLFRRTYEQELQMSLIDDINTWYVAMTRASLAMHVLVPSKTGLAGFLLNYLEKENVSHDGQEGQLHYLYGAAEPLKAPRRRELKPVGDEIALEYLPAGENATARRPLAIRKDGSDFFREAAAEESARTRGIVMHKILEGVRTEEELAASVEKARRDGLLDRRDAEAALALLKEALGSVASRGWFSSDGASVLDERDLSDADGNVYRPDRVVIRNGRVEIIDYKFGAEEKSYEKQLRHYASLYNGLGYKDVSAYIWYIYNKRIVKVE